MQPTGHPLFVAAQGRRRFPAACWQKTGILDMTDAQIGLAVSTPIIVLFSIALHKMGVLQRYSTIAAVVASVAIAAVLYTQQ